jgi:hypothetical protein
VIQHDLHAVACGCGRVHQAAAPEGAGAAGTVTYGLNLQAWCVFLMAAHAIPGYGADCRASAILAPAQRREVRPNIWASFRSESGLPAFTLSRYAATAA